MSHERWHCLKFNFVFFLDLEPSFRLQVPYLDTGLHGPFLSRLRLKGIPGQRRPTSGGRLRPKDTLPNEFVLKQSPSCRERSLLPRSPRTTAQVSVTCRSESGCYDLVSPRGPNVYDQGLWQEGERERRTEGRTEEQRKKVGK